MEKFTLGGKLDSIEEFLDSPGAKEELRKILLSKPLYKESISQAVGEFAKKIAKNKISQSISRAKAEGDMETRIRLIKAKQNLELDSKRT